MTAFFFSACGYLFERLPQKPFDSKKSRELISALKHQNDRLETFKGIGKIKFFSKGKHQYARMAWVGQRPEKLRIEILGMPGQRTASLASDGKWIYLLSLTDHRFYKKRSTEAGLENFISIPVKLTDIHAFLTGRVPIHEHRYALVEKSAHGYVLILKKEWENVLEKIYFDNSEKAVHKVEMFDSSGFLLYRVVFGRMKNIKGYKIPYRLRISNEEGVIFKLDIAQYWADVSVSPSAFVLTPPESD